MKFGVVVLAVFFLQPVVQAVMRRTSSGAVINYDDTKFFLNGYGQQLIKKLKKPLVGNILAAHFLENIVFVFFWPLY